MIVREGVERDEERMRSEKHMHHKTRSRTAGRHGTWETAEDENGDEGEAEEQSKQ